MFRITSNKKGARIVEVLVFIILIALFLIVILILKR